MLSWFTEQISNIRSYARVALDLFRIDAPNGIGSLSSFKSTADTRSAEPILGPYILPSGLHTPSTVFQSIEEYFKWLISVKKTLAGVGTTKPDLDEARATLERLENLISESVSGYDAAFLRGVPSHQDFCGQNVFINDEGFITGVIDWEFHMVKPAVLAAAYPDWIRYDGTADPRFVNKKGQFSSFWMASPVDAKRLRREYDAVCVNTFNQ
jgi:Phosphotransferase enzyme family